MMGDLNAHTGRLGVDLACADTDIIGLDDNIDYSEWDRHSMDTSDSSVASNCDRFNNKRQSQCTKQMNIAGDELLSLCETARMYILNGQFGVASAECTYTGRGRGSVVDYICVDERLVDQTIDMIVLDDITYQTISDHSPIMAVMLWGASARYWNDINTENSEAISETKIWLWINEWREDTYSEQWTIRWKNGHDDVYDRGIHKWMTEYEGINHVDDMIEDINLAIWDCAEQAMCIKKIGIQLPRDKWGICKYTEPIDKVLYNDDIKWLEKGWFPQREWWNEECMSATRALRTAHKRLKACMKRREGVDIDNVIELRK